MFNAIIINEIRDSATGQTYKLGDRVRVLMKTVRRHGSEYIGVITKITPGGFSILVEDYEEKFISLELLDKMRFAGPDETFYNTFEF